MSASGLEVFDRTIQTTNAWLHEINDDLGPDRNHAWHVLGAVLRALRDQLPAELAAHLAAQLPLLIRGGFYEAWNPSAADRKAKTEAEFIAKVETNLHGTRPGNPRRAAISVLGVLCRHVDREQLIKIRNALSESVRKSWPADLLSEALKPYSGGQHARIEQRAHEIWERADRPTGEDVSHWLQAEREIEAGTGAKPIAAKEHVSRSARATAPRVRRSARISSGAGR